jgi:hypothetical protein
VLDTGLVHATSDVVLEDLAGRKGGDGVTEMLRSDERKSRGEEERESEDCERRSKEGLRVMY